jgi:hypothetical protein
MTDVITQWRDYAKHQSKINIVYTEYKQKIDSEKVERGFSTFQKGIDRLRLIKAKNAKADQFRQINMFKNIKDAWMAIVVGNRIETSKVVKIRNRLKRKLITK